jgi:hypothetical protein
MFRLLGPRKHVFPSLHDLVKIPAFLKKCLIITVILTFSASIAIFLCDSTYFFVKIGSKKEKWVKKYATRNTTPKNRALVLQPQVALPPHPLNSAWEFLQSGHPIPNPM